MLRDSGATINLKTKSGSTPLHYAANNYSGNSARMLLKAGAGPNARNNSRECPLHIAAKDGNFGTVKALLIGGADVNAAGQRIATGCRRATIRILLQFGPLSLHRHLVSIGHVHALNKSKQILNQTG